MADNILVLDGEITKVKPSIDELENNMMEAILAYARANQFIIDIDDHGNGDNLIDNIHIQSKNKILLIY